ncbi:MAG: hypothetical protein LBL66_06615 [Clostridiales bacterium]|jgi:hypothetical protein|nr:hypothetical protein [Clostridiales bacterium]
MIYCIALIGMRPDLSAGNAVRAAPSYYGRPFKNIMESLPFLLLSDKQYEALPDHLKPAKGNEAAKAKGLLTDKVTGNSPYWLCSPSGVKPDLVKVVSGNGRQDDAQTPAWSGYGVRVFLPIDRAVCDLIKKPSPAGAGHSETVYPDWAIVELPGAGKCLLAKTIFEPYRYDYSRGSKGKPQFEGSQIQKRIRSYEFARDYVELSLYGVLTRRAGAAVGQAAPANGSAAGGGSIDVWEIWNASGGDPESAERLLKGILAAKLKAANNSRAAQAEVLKLSQEILPQLKKMAVPKA